MYASYFLYNSRSFFISLNKKMPFESYLTAVYTVQFTHKRFFLCIHEYAL